jgi:hypothetical protein
MLDAWPAPTTTARRRSSRQLRVEHRWEAPCCEQLREHERRELDDATVDIERYDGEADGVVATIGSADTREWFTPGSAITCHHRTSRASCEGLPLKYWNVFAIFFAEFSRSLVGVFVA